MKSIYPWNRGEVLYIDGKIYSFHVNQCISATQGRFWDERTKTPAQIALAYHDHITDQQERTAA